MKAASRQRPRHTSISTGTARQPGDAVFVSGHPGNTDRLLTAAQLDVQRDTFMPFWLMRFSELRGRMIQYSKTGEEPRRIAESYLNSVENSIKVRRKQFDALLDPALIANAREKEQALGSAAGSFDQIAKAQDAWRNILVPYTFIESGAAFNSQLFEHARTLVRAAAERAKPNETRLPEFTEARLPAVVQGLGADTPIYPEFEALRLSFGLERMREWLGPDDRSCARCSARTRRTRSRTAPCSRARSATPRRAWRCTRAGRPPSTRARIP